MNNELEPNKNLAVDFPQVVEHYLRCKERKALDRNRDILYRRYGLLDNNTYTLQDLGTYHGLARERVRQIQEKIVTNLGKLLSGTLRGCSIDPAYLEQHSRIETALSESSRIYTTGEIKTEIRWYLGDCPPKHWLKLFLTVLGYRQLNASGHAGRISELADIWGPRGAKLQRDLDRVFEILHRVHREVEGRSSFDIVVQAKRAGGRNVDREQVRMLAGACGRLEETPDGRIRPRFCALPSGVDRAWRVLSENQHQMYYYDIGREINRREAESGGGKVFDDRHVTNRMAEDDRFRAVGKSGYWVLKEWAEVETGAIWKVMEHVLHGAGKPLPLTELTERALARRPDASEKSIRTYVDDRPKLFGWTEDHRVTLKVWKMTERAPGRRLPRIEPETFLQAVRGIAAERPEIARSELIARLASLLGASEVSCRQWLAKLEGLEVQPGAGRRAGIVRFRIGEIGFRGEVVCKTKRDRIQAEIVRCRARHDTEGMTGKQLHALVNQRVPCKLPTFYRYLSELDKAMAADSLEESGGAENSQRLARLGRPPGRLARAGGFRGVVQ